MLSTAYSSSIFIGIFTLGIELYNLLYGIYQKNLERLLSCESSHIPHHIGVILDGNRRWAKSIGENASFGHQKGADKVFELLDWCGKFDVKIVTLWMLSTDNLKRSPQELSGLLNIIVATVERIANHRKWKIRIVGALDLLPEEVSNRLLKAQNDTEHIEGIEVNIAVGYGGRQEILDAFKSYMNSKQNENISCQEAVQSLTIENIDEHLYTAGQPHPDLVIRTSGEQRLSGFLLWQSAQSEFYFCETYWPSFRYVDFLRALRDYVHRDRRMGK